MHSVPLLVRYPPADAHCRIMRVIFDHVRPSGRIMPVMQVIEAQSARSWGLTITSITNMTERYMLRGLGKWWMGLRFLVAGMKGHHRGG